MNRYQQARGSFIHSVLQKTMRLIPRREIVPFFTALAALVLASTVALAGTAQTTPIQVSRRVVAQPVPAAPVVKPVTRYAGPSVPAGPECPQMNNPGGLRWVPSANAGPWATGGTVQIPRFGVAAPVYKVGVNTSNEMVLPHNSRDVAWLDQGPFPGDTQNAVLAGHIRYSGVPGSFGRILSMNPGDVVVVEMDGKRWEFQVRWTCLFARDTALAEQIMGYTNVPSVTLISCGGVFDRAAGTHNKRVAVRAELVRQA